MSSASRTERLQTERQTRTRRRRRRAASAVVVLIGAAVAISAGAVGDVEHGIAFTKGCTSPINVGDQYRCTYTAQNILDEAHDTLTIDSLVDVVHAAGGDVNSGELLGVVKLDNGGTAATCSGVGITGTGTVADPWTGATECTLPFGSKIHVQSNSFYTATAADFLLPGHALRDSANLGWHDKCDDPLQTGNSNCNPDPDPVAAASQAIVRAPATTTTQIHNGTHAVVTTVEVGTTVHDFVHVAGPAGQSVPTGNVSIDWFTNGSCTLPFASNSGSVGPLNASGNYDATGFSFTPLTAGHFAFKAHYLGAPPYLGSDGPCEPLTVVDANIQITPPLATNRVGTNHTLTGHVNVNNGSGFVPAPAGTTITFSKVSGPGSFVGGVNTCLTILATGSCSVQITSATPGLTTIQATTTVTVGGISLTRTTGDGKAGDSANARKRWADDVVTTTVRDALNNDITGQTVPPGTIVHDVATVTKTANTPPLVPGPTGTVTFTLYDNGTCNGNILVTDSNKALVNGVATSVTFSTPTAGTFSYLAHYNGDVNYPQHDGPCEPFTVSKPATANLTPGYWKNHEAATQALLDLAPGIFLGNYPVTTFADAHTILSGMGCGSDGRLNCMAGMLLAAELNLAQGGTTCIQPVVDQANALLIKYGYAGFGTYNLSPADSALAQQLHDQLSAYNIDGVPTC
ncbi:MAG: Ig-like domain-containing protein [Actinomycetota bacterium]|nr:Ig-like domain-containing protein [Actinomycetota bacterium]